MPDNGQHWSAVDHYISDHLIGEDAVQQRTLEANRKAGLPAIDVSAAQGKMLQLLAKGAGAKRILEIGTLGGYSTIWLARALPEDGCVVTLELEESYAQLANENINNAGLRGQVEVIVGEAVKSLSAIDHQSTQPFDFVFIDADKQNYSEYLEHAIRLSRPGAMLLFDNVVREGEILNPDSDDPKVPGTRALYETLKNHPRVDATAVQTVGSKKWDGFLLAITR
ncbi:MAG: O-methyltransferase [Parasphingorhabdus sp.]